MDNGKTELSKAVGAIPKFAGTMMGTAVAIRKRITAVGIGSVSVVRSLLTRHVDVPAPAANDKCEIAGVRRVTEKNRKGPNQINIDSEDIINKIGNRRANDFEQSPKSSGAQINLETSAGIEAQEPQIQVN